MANEVVAPGGTSGGTAYFLLWNLANGQIWNTSGTPAFEAYDGGNIADYDIALTEAGTSATFIGSLPTLSRGIYGIEARMRAGGTPAQDDETFATGTIRWTGSAEEPVQDSTSGVVEANVAQISADATAADNLEAILDGGGAALTVSTLTATTNAIAWNAAWDAEVESEVTDALNAYDPPTNTEMAAAFTEIKGATWATTDTLEAIRDRGDAAWITATGFSTHSASDVWAVGTRTLTAFGFTVDINSNADITAILADTNELQADWADGGRLDLIVDAILVDTTEIGVAGAGLTVLATAAALATVDSEVGVIDGIVDAILVDTAVIGAAGAGLTAIPWNAAWDAEVQSEATDAINALFTFTVAGQADVNVQYVNDVQVTGTGAAGSEWGPAA